MDKSQWHSTHAAAQSPPKKRPAKLPAASQSPKVVRKSKLPAAAQSTPARG